MAPVSRQGAGNSRSDRAFAALMQAAASKTLAAQQPEPLKTALTQRADETIAAVAKQFADPAPSPMIPGAWPAPTKEALNLATSLTTLAASLQPGGMKDTLESAAAALVKSAYSGTALFQGSNP